MGADLAALDDFTLALLTNDEILAVNQASRDNREVYRRDDLAVWQATSPHGDIYVAHFNLRDPVPGASSAPVPVMLASLGIDGSARVRDLWQRSDLGAARDVFAPQVACHGAGLFRLTPA